MAVPLTREMRCLRRNLAWTGPAIGILALGIGTNVAVFAVAHAVLLRPLPFADQDRLAVVWEQDRTSGHPVWEVSYRDFRDWESQNASFRGMAALGSTNWSLRLTSADGPVILPYAGISGTFFEVLGVEALLGRRLTPQDDRRESPPVLVLSQATWQTHFGGDPGVIGRSATIDIGRGPRAFTVAGVMPRAVDFPRGAAAWLPLAQALPALPAPEGFDPLESREFGVLYAIGRLRDGVTFERARADLDVITARLTRGGERGSGRTAVATSLPVYIFGQTRPALLVLLGAAALLFILTCANAVGLLAGRLSGRQRDIAVQIALGARRRDLAKPVVVEAALIAVLALSGALAVAAGATSVVTMIAPDNVPRLANVTPFAPTPIAFAILNVLGVVVACGAIPLLTVTRTDPRQALLAGARIAGGSLRARRALVTFQTALAVVLLVCAMLAVRSFHTIRHVDPGFNPAGVVTFDVVPARGRYGDQVNERFYRRLLEALQPLPGVQSVAALYLRPFELGPIGSDTGVLLEGQSLADRDAWRENPLLNAQAVTPDYFDVMQVPLIAGRVFNDSDTDESSPVVVVGETAARRLWPGADPIGKRLRSGTARRRGWQTVVGVVGDVHYRALVRATPDLYTPYLQAHDEVQHVVVRIAGDPSAFLGRLRDAVRTVDPAAALDGVRPLTHVVERQLTPWRFTALLLSLLAAVALGVAVIALYALLAGMVVDRTREIGIRVALGARRGDVIRVVTMRALGIVVTGLIAGLVAGFGAGRVMRTLLFGVESFDPVTFATVALLLMAAATVGAYWPVRRALSVDPIVALRQE